MRALVRRVFANWTEACEYLTFLSVCLAGLFNASWLWPLVGAMVLLLVGWERYSELFVKAARIDTQYLVLARLALRHGCAGFGFSLLLKARLLVIVLAAKLGHDALFLVGAFIFGHVTRWLWW
jgi:hypothetical protein